MTTGGKAALSSILSLAVFVVLVFGPAGTFRYWQGWVFLAVFAVATWFPSIYLQRTNPAALQRRMRAGPFAETRAVQKVVSTLVFVLFLTMIVFSVLDQRFGWSSVPTAICLLGDALVAIGLVATMAVVIQNGYAAANVVVEAGQSVISTGLYGVVRHPMYAGTIPLLIGVPLALGSYWGLTFLPPSIAVLAVRIRDEETMLTEKLPGYRAYTARVRYRLLPGVW